MAQSANPEDEWFARIDAERKARLAASVADKDSAQKAADRKALHQLHCGKCGEKMLTQAYRDVEIEICPSCGAVLLDAGELQKLAGADRGQLVDTVAKLFGMRKDKA